MNEELEEDLTALGELLQKISKKHRSVYITMCSCEDSNVVMITTKANEDFYSTIIIEEKELKVEGK